MKTFATFRTEERPRITATRPENDTVSGETTRLLVVEDDPILLSTLKYNLTREGYCVDTASDGDSLDLVILDIMLPGMSGYQVLRQLREEQDVPVILLSARGEEQDKIDGLEFGADDYVVKPFALREFLARVRAVCRRRAVPAARPPAVLYRGDLRIELDERRAFVGGYELSLRPKEFGLLVALAMEAGKVLNRQQLLDSAWGEDVVVDERTVDVHISWLRGKLQAAGLPGEVIRTVYAAGYRFEVISGAAQDRVPADSPGS
jgi:DNA-binding response OmpR family regulator